MNCPTRTSMKEAKYGTDFPAIRRLRRPATNHAAVSAPHGRRSSLPGIPGGTPSCPCSDRRTLRCARCCRNGLRQKFDATAPDGLFGTARRLGFTTEMAGYYFAYCDLFGASVDVCRSFSFYNTATADAGFSPIHPLLTTMILWPGQFPFGLLKNRPFAVHQRNLVEETTAFALRPVPPDHPVFPVRALQRAAPAVCVRSRRYDPPSILRTTPDTAYVRQTAFVDRLLERLLAPLRDAGQYDSTAIVILSDHGYRFQGGSATPADPVHRQECGAEGEDDASEPAQGEMLLKRFLETACDPGG